MGAVFCRDRGKATFNNTHEQSPQRPQTFNSTSTTVQSFCTARSGEIIEEVVCRENEIGENEMKAVDFFETKALLIKQNGMLYATGSKCPHYGAPLYTGALGDGRVRCPWHGACFNIATGDVEDFPGLDSLPCYKVSVKDGQVKIRAKKSDLDSTKRIKDMVGRNPTNDKTYIIIGGGPSGGVCAETLRQECFSGRLVMICKEDYLPYDRVKLSKAMNLEIQALQYRTPEFYEKYAIETMLGVEATKVDAHTRTVTCSNGYSIKYDKLYIATGSKPARPNIPGADLKNVFMLRDHVDAAEIFKHVDNDAEVVCLGSSFISLEAAAFLANKVKKVTVIGRDVAPFVPSLGVEVGRRVSKLFKANGVNMVMESGIVEFMGDDDGCVKSVQLKDGTILDCNFCILGTGSTFNTEFLKNSGVKLNDNGSIDVDNKLRTNVDNIYAGGDIANAPIYALNNEKATIGHYQLAQYHGRIAATNMGTCSSQELKAVPFFWTSIFGKSIRYSGYGKPTETRIIGNIEDLAFVAMYFNSQGFVIGMASCGRDPIVAQFAELTTRGRKLHKNDLEEDEFAWTKTISI